ncbi:MAG: energy transducer TonB [Phenylobacterium sp.]|uniref:energy transducer TonB n=1 Tax=Phenylobacterium sp. TaxID=1871053 RepID=UPI0025F42188|nr:energy transducer TonB [Phenylobacterium sp.]MCA3739256.1 energy transducer TonB [Phenylobacterium sp.]
MAEDITHPVRNPFDLPPPQRGRGFWIAGLVALLLHVAVGFALWKQRFELQIREFSDDVTDVEIIKPMAPPPPPPPPPPNTPPPPPPKLQPRPPVAVPNAPTIPPLPVPPVEKRIEEPRPPAPAPEPPRPSVITNPDWARRPSGEDIARYYPDRAQRMEVEGRVTLSCKVTAKGLLEGCSVVSEDPADQDFGSAAMRMTRLFKMRPQTKDGAPVEGGTVRIPLRFQMPKD